MWIYEQATGKLSHDGIVKGIGYSGLGAGVNNPELQDIPNVGPIPRGLWSVSPPYDTDDHGPYVLRLTPASDTMTFGRAGFLIHGDEIEHAGEHLASHGCVVLARNLREAIWSSGDHSLTVIERDLSTV